MTQFPAYQHKRLQDISKVREDMNYPTLPNVELEEYTKTLKSLYPEMFHTSATLHARVFMDAPTTSSIPYARFVREKEASPYYESI